MKEVEYCQKNYRPFVYTETTLDATAPDGAREDDLYHVMYAAAQVFKIDHRGHHFDRVVCGGLQIDEEEFYAQGAKKRLKESEQLFKFILDFRSDIPLPDCQICFLHEWSKNEAWHYLPIALQELAWYCRSPVYENERYSLCGNCESCTHVREMVKIASNELLFQWRLFKNSRSNSFLNHKRGAT